MQRISQISKEAFYGGAFIGTIVWQTLSPMLLTRSFFKLQSRRLPRGMKVQLKQHRALSVATRVLVGVIANRPLRSHRNAFAARKRNEQNACCRAGLSPDMVPSNCRIPVCRADLVSSVINPAMRRTLDIKAMPSVVPSNRFTFAHSIKESRPGRSV